LDQRGMNLALPPESMHVVCLGYMPHIVQGFSQVRKLKVGSATENDNDRGTHYVFGEEYLNHAQVEAKLIKLGKILQKQPDPDKPRTAFMTFLIDSDPKQTCKTKKKAHEMRGVLLTLLFFMILSENSDDLATRMGEKNILNT